MSSPRVRWVIVLSIMLVAVVTSLGKIRYALNPIARRIVIESFVQRAKSEGRIDPEYFWEVRDFVGATTAHFTPADIDRGKPFLTWKSPYLTSEDRLIPGPVGADRLTTDRSATTLYQDSTSRISSHRGILTIVFTQPLDAMTKANGYLGLYKIDLSRYTDHVWYANTSIQL